MRVLREPLLHFFLIGAALFAAHALWSGEAPRRDVVVVSRGRIDNLAAQFEATHGRPPDPAERNGLIEAWVKEEILVREALALGLDREDTVIRDRLRQKMEFVAGGADATPEAKEAAYKDIARRYEVSIEGSP
jgi:hypothetical protein